MDKAAVIAKISCIEGFEGYYDWATEKNCPTGIEPPALNKHIIGEVLETLNHFELNNIMFENLDFSGIQRFIMREMDHFEKHGCIRRSC